MDIVRAKKKTTDFSMTPIFEGAVVAVIYDDPRHMKPLADFTFPANFAAEWESDSTVRKIAETWSALGAEVILLPLEESFFSKWQRLIPKLSFVHTLVEGWGSLARESWIPSLCELSGVPYIGSSPLAHCVGMRKTLLKVICEKHGIPTAPFFLLRSLEDINKVPKKLLNCDHFLKPDCEGSGMGISAEGSVCKGHKETYAKAKSLLEQYPEGIVLEELLPGREFTSAIVGDQARFLPVAEIEVEGGVYGLAQKSKVQMDEKITFPKLDEKKLQELHYWSKTLFTCLDMADLVRIDWKENAAGELQLLEVNTLPGLSYYYSVLPKMAEEAGLSYETLFELLGNSALKRRQARQFRYGQSLFPKAGGNEIIS